jgi:hypothetical protein
MLYINISILLFDHYSTFNYYLAGKKSIHQGNTQMDGFSTVDFQGFLRF